MYITLFILAVILAVLGILVHFFDGPNFKSGDIIEERHAEKWETDASIFKVLEIGKSSYHLEYMNPGELVGRKTTRAIDMVDAIYRLKK